MSKEVMIVTGAGQISMAITRRIGYGKKIVMGDKKLENAQEIAKVMNDAGFDVEPMKMDLSSRESILNLIAKAKEYGEIKMLVNGAGVSPSQAPIEAILKVDLYGTAVLLEEVGKLIDEKLYVIGNIDATIIAQRPKMAPHIEQMRKNVAEALHIEVEQVNIKATTEEGLGFTGAGKGISSQAIASLDTIANYSYRVGPAEGGCAGCGGCMKAQDR